MLTQSQPGKEKQRAKPLHSKLLYILCVNCVAEADTGITVNDMDKATKLKDLSHQQKMFYEKLNLNFCLYIDSNSLQNLPSASYNFIL